MRLPVRFFLICTFLCAPFLSKAQVALGDSLFALGDFQRASIAYEYASFQGLAPEMNNTIALKSARCYKQLSKPEMALRVLERADFYFGNDSSRFLLFYEYSLVAILANRYDVALSKLQELRFEITDTSKLVHLLPLEIIALNELERWPEAQQKYKQLAAQYGVVENPYPEIMSFKKKNPDKAMTLSYFLPGVGQMYAGYFWKGAVSTLLNLGLMGFSGWSFLNGYFFSGTFTGVALFYLSYNGGARYAEVLANQYNATKVTQFNQSVKRQVIDMASKK